MLRQSHTKVGSQLSDRLSGTFYSSMRPFLYKSIPLAQRGGRLSCFSQRSFKVILSFAVSWHFGSLWQRGRKGGIWLRAVVLTSGSSMSICPRRSLCKHDQSPDQPRLSKRSKPRLVWLSLLTVWLRVCIQGSTEKRDDTAACTD